MNPLPLHCKRLDTGFSYVEVLLAVLLLSVCLVPALNAVRGAIGAPLVAQDNATAMLCVKSQMEKILAEPYPDLLAAAAPGTQSGPVATASPSYSMAADTACPARNVYIARHNPYDSTKFPASDTGLLYVTVSAPDLSTSPAGTSYTFSTLVAR